uniref:BAI1 associated protein 3 n=1 Tax=Callorhinchus milii TaxID=7868 RepID=A0A4W3JFU7_CALMI
MLQRAKAAKPPSFGMRVTVVEARNLMAKDANGFSDPYCMLGIMVGPATREHEERKERRFSFRRKKEKMEKRASVREGLPAKYIQVTEVKPSTLNPVWNHSYVFELDDIQSDQLHLDIWYVDHDDEVSVAEACKKLNEVSSFKGMGRYFKQIVKSARTNREATSAEDNADDFLGCLNIPINVGRGRDPQTLAAPHPLPSTPPPTAPLPSPPPRHGLPAHLTLTPRSASPPDHSPSTQSPPTHCPPLGPPDPQLPPILEWQAYSKHHQSRSMDYAFLLQLLLNLEEKWEPGDFSREQEQALAQSFSMFSEYTWALLHKLRQVFPFNITVALRRLELILRYWPRPHPHCPAPTHTSPPPLSSPTPTTRTPLPSPTPTTRTPLPSPTPTTRTPLPGPADSKSLALVGFHDWFQSSINKWLQIVHKKSCERIRKAVEMDQLEPVDSLSRHSSSAVDVVTCFSQIRNFWLQLAWPDPMGAFIFITRITDVSNWEGVRERDCAGKRGRERETGREGERGREEDIVKAGGGEGGREADSLTPCCPQAVSPLMKFLDDNLMILSEWLVRENLSRILSALWKLLLDLIEEILAENRGLSMEFYGRFHFTLEALVEFFHAEGQGLSLEELRNKEYQEELRLNKCTTRQLIEQFFLDKLHQQKSMEHSPYGTLVIKLYYNTIDHKLHVLVLHATNLIALDSNGLSDPFVIVHLAPHHSFPGVKGHRTQVKTKTLHPVYDEHFHFTVSVEQCRLRAACIHLTVMDHDWLSTNDFAGEAVSPLGQVPGLDGVLVPGGLKNTPALTLKLTHPGSRGNMLEGRSEDREAHDFIKKLKELERS